jgi:hypothetical protein
MAIVDKNGYEAWAIKVIGRVVKFSTEVHDKQALSKTEFVRTYFTDNNHETTDKNIVRQLNIQPLQEPQPVTDVTDVTDVTNISTTTQTEASNNENNANSTAKDNTNQAQMDLAQNSASIENAVPITDASTLATALSTALYGKGALTISSVDIGNKTSSIYNQDQDTSTITLSTKLLTSPTITIQDLAIALAHEFAHLRNARCNTNDTCGGGHYHNEAFKIEAEDIYLTAVKTRGQGWGNSTPTQKFINILRQLSIDPAASVLAVFANDPVVSQAVGQVNSSRQAAADRLAMAREARGSTQSEIAALRAEVSELKVMIAQLLETRQQQA